MDSKARHRLLSTVDRLLLERGELDPLEYLLAIGGVDYADYREWRHRRRPVLQSALRRHRFDAGSSALERLRELPDTHVLINDYLRRSRAAERCSTEPAARLRELEEDIAPLAASTLAVRARDYLAPLWAELAERLE